MCDQLVDGIVERPCKRPLISLVDGVFFEEVSTGSRWSCPIFLNHSLTCGCQTRNISRKVILCGDIGAVVHVGNVPLETLCAQFGIDGISTFTHTILVAAHVTI